MNAKYRTDTHPWVGIVVNNRRIDGYWHVDRDYRGLVRASTRAVVLSILVQPGDTVAAGDRLAVVDAMKMETQVLAPFAGKIRQVMATPNAEVSPGDPMLAPFTRLPGVPWVSAVSKQVLLMAIMMLFSLWSTSSRVKLSRALFCYISST